MKIIIDEWGNRVKPGSVLIDRQGVWRQVTDLCPDDPAWQIGAIHEGGDEDEGDYHPAWFFNCEVIEEGQEAHT